MLKTALIVSLLLAAAPALAGQSSSSGLSLAQIEKAERAFAADGLALGVRDSFLRHMADDAIVFSPGPVSAKALYTAQPSNKTPKLEWWPQRVVIARSGDLGLSVGPWAINGERGAYYTTIWRKGSDGTWKWVYDGGGDADGAKGPDPATPSTQGPTAAKGAGSPVAGFAQARAAEDRLAAAAAQDAASAYDAVLSADALLTGPGGTKALAVDDLDGRRKLRPAAMILTPVGGGASRAGDLVWIHGHAHWTANGPKPVAAHYMHVWQRRAEGWRLIFETLINDP